MSTDLTPTPVRFTLRNLPLPAKLVLTTFLLSVGLGYLWAMAQIHFKHASAGEPMPTLADLVARFSGVPWPLVPKPDPAEEETRKEVNAKAEVGIGQQVFAVKIKSVLNERCVRCHGPGKDESDKPLHTYGDISKYLVKKSSYPKGKLHAVLAEKPKRAKHDFDGNDMSEAFFSESADWPAAADQQQAQRPGREAERQAVLAWVEAGADKAAYDADAFPLPPVDARFKELTARFRAAALAPVPAAATPGAPKAEDKWAHAKSRQLSVESLTQSTHAHLLTFSLLWAATGLVFAFTSYSTGTRCVLSPLVLIAQVLDVGCWWLARLDGVGPYFALAIMATGGIVGLGLVAQIVLSIWNMYGPKGKAFVALLFLTGALLFGLAYVKVIQPQIQEERDFIARQEQSK